MLLSRAPRRPALWSALQKRSHSGTARARSTVKTLESSIISEKHADKLVTRYAYKSKKCGEISTLTSCQY